MRSVSCKYLLMEKPSVFFNYYLFYSLLFVWYLGEKEEYTITSQTLTPNLISTPKHFKICCCSSLWKQKYNLSEKNLMFQFGVKMFEFLMVFACMFRFGGEKPMLFGFWIKYLNLRIRNILTPNPTHQLRLSLEENSTH